LELCKAALRLANHGERSISTKRILLGDIGATNARFALLADGQVGPVKSFDVAGFPRFTDAAAMFLKKHCDGADLTEALFAVAGPVEADRCVLTNCSWVIDARELYQTFGFEARIINDFEAVAHSLPSLTAADLVKIGGGEVEPAAPMVVLGPGTGLGVAGSFRDRVHRSSSPAKAGTRPSEALAATEKTIL
jgi:glucokinase